MSAQPEEEDDYDSADDEDYDMAADPDFAAAQAEEAALKAAEDKKRKRTGAAGTKPKKKMAANPSSRGRTGGRIGGIALSDDEEEAAAEAAAAAAAAAKVPETAEETVASEAAEKARLDALFAAELGIAPPKPAVKKKSAAGNGAASKKKKKKKGGVMEFRMPGMGGVKAPKSAASRQTKITVTKEYDFAGETIKVSKEVDAGSREAKNFERAQKKAAAPPSALQGLLGAIGGKKKMSTVTKTALDWDHFKDKEGISDELAQHNKGSGSFLEKQAFLQRADHRAHDQELAWKDRERLKRT